MKTHAEEWFDKKQGDYIVKLAAEPSFDIPQMLDDYAAEFGPDSSELMNYNRHDPEDCSACSLTGDNMCPYHEGVEDGVKLSGIAEDTLTLLKAKYPHHLVMIGCVAEYEANRASENRQETRAESLLRFAAQFRHNCTDNNCPGGLIERARNSELAQARQQAIAETVEQCASIATVAANAMGQKPAIARVEALRIADEIRSLTPPPALTKEK